MNHCVEFCLERCEKSWGHLPSYTVRVFHLTIFGDPMKHGFGCPIAEPRQRRAVSIDLSVGWNGITCVSRVSNHSLFVWFMTSLCINGKNPALNSGKWSMDLLRQFNRLSYIELARQ